MAQFTFICDVCGTAFTREINEEELTEPLECPKCHSHQTQLDLSMFTTYGYGDSDSEQDNCSGGSGFR